MENIGTQASLISVAETARLLKISKVMVYRRFHTGVFPGRRVGRKIDLYEPFITDLLSMIHSGVTVDVDAFAADWKARNAQQAAA